MGKFNVSLTLTGIETGRSETMDAVVDREVIHSIIPANTLARLGITPTRRSSVIDLPLGTARVQLHVQVDDCLNPDRGDYCPPITVLFGPDDCQPILGRTALTSLNLAVDPDHDRLIPAEIRIPGYELVSALRPASRIHTIEDDDGTV